ncbi:MAG: TolC family protein [Thiotrichaceae bacterium]
MPTVFTFQRYSLLGVLGSVFIAIQLLTMPSLFASSAPQLRSKLAALSGFLTQIENKHPRLKADQAGLKAAQALTQAASSPLYNPELELDVERVGFGSNREDAATIGINQTIDWHDKRSARKNIAVSQQQVTKYESDVTRQQLIGSIFSELANYQVQQEILRAHGKRLQLTKQIFAQATRLYKAGDISKLNLEQVSLSHVQTQLALNQAKVKLVATSRTLVSVAGVDLKKWPSLPYAPPTMRPVTLNYTQISNDLPSLKAAQSRVVVARNTMRLRVREQKPDPTIGLKAGGEDSNKVVGLTLSIPLHLRNNFSAGVDEARSNVKRAEALLENSQHQSLSRLKSAAQTYHLTYTGWQSWTKIAGNSLQKQSYLLMRLWKAGEVSTSDYLLQLNQIREVELNQVKLKGNVWKAWFDWLSVSNQFRQWLDGKAATHTGMHTGTHTRIEIKNDTNK